MAPSNHGAILDDCGKRACGGLDLLHILQLVLHGTAITYTPLRTLITIIILNILLGFI